MPAIDILRAGACCHDVTLGLLAGEVTHHVDVVTALLKGVSLVQVVHQRHLTGFLIHQINGLNSIQVARERRHIQVTEVVHAHGVGTQRCTAIHFSVQRQGQLLNHIAIGGIQLVDDTL